MESRSTLAILGRSVSVCPGIGGGELFEQAILPSGPGRGLMGQVNEGLCINPCGGIISLIFISNEKKKTVQKVYQRTVATLSITLGKLCVRSTHGLIKTAPAGSGLPRSRRIHRKETHNPPPAESPATTILLGGTGECNADGGGSVRYKSRRNKV